MSEITALEWNVYTNHDVDHVLHELRGMISEHNPDVIALFEAKHLYHHLGKLGYSVHQLRSKRAQKGLQPATANVALLVRHGLVVRKTLTMRMMVRWRGPKKGAPQSPRVYRWLKFEKGGDVWKIGGFHIPFGTSARTETFIKIRLWFLKTVVGRPTVGLGDYNSGKDFVRKNVAKKVGGHVGGFGIDLATYINCHLKKQRDLGHHGSDHPAVLFVLEH